MHALDPTVCRRARLARDRRFDGEFFLAVITTGIYCRPVCPARPPREENVRYFRSAAEAAQAGFRPCLRCRPESAPWSPAWLGTDTTVRRALALIMEGFLNQAPLSALADRLGVGERYLRKLFQQKLGVSPTAVAQTQRLHLAQKLVLETELPMTDVAFAAGFSSLRRFNSATREAFGCAPGELRRAPRKAPGSGLALSLTFRPPYDWQGVHALFSRHAVEGLDSVNDGSWTRALRTPGGAAVVTIRQGGSDHLLAELKLSDNRELMIVIAQLRRMFDLDAQPQDISEGLATDPALAPLLHEHPGLRSPVFATPFESCIRAVVGQQISTVAARTQLGSLVAAVGSQAEIEGRPTTLFPTPGEFLEIDDEVFRMPRSRRQTLRAVAELFAAGEPDQEALAAVRGIGPWTLDLVAMRGHGDPDRFPVSDLGLVKAAEAQGITRRELPARSQHWQPWRSYAANLLWRSLSHG